MLDDISRQTRRLFASDGLSWCAFAWANQNRRFWRLWVRVIDWVDPGHCERSWRRYF